MHARPSCWHAAEGRGPNGTVSARGACGACADWGLWCKAVLRSELEAFLPVLHIVCLLQLGIFLVSIALCCNGRSLEFAAVKHIVTASKER